MSKAKLYYTGRIEGGVLKINGRRGFDQDIAAMEGRKVQLELKPYHATRSKQQNAYYWACVIPYVMDGLNAMGIAKYELSKEIVHEMLKAKFLKEDLASEHWDGEFITVIGSTTDLNKLEFSDYIDQIKRWSEEFLNIRIPEAGEQSDINFNYYF